MLYVPDPPEELGDNLDLREAWRMGYRTAMLKILLVVSSNILESSPTYPRPIPKVKESKRPKKK